MRQLYRRQVLSVRETLDSAPRFWASSDLRAGLAGVLQHVATRWAIEDLFAETKDPLGLDQYQLLSVTALPRFWPLVLAAVVFLEDERAHAQQPTGRRLTLGQTRRAVQDRHQAALGQWLCDQHDQGCSPATITATLAA